MNRPKFLQSPIFNDCMKVNIDGYTRLKIVLKLLLQVSVRKFHSSLVSVPVDCGLK